MKNLKNTTTYLILLVLALFMLSCSKDDDNTQMPEPTNQELILGRWSLESRSPGTPLSACEKESSFIFLKKGTMIQSYYSKNFDGYCELSSIPPADYSFSDDDLIKVEYFESDTFFINVVSISKNELVISIEQGSVITTLTLKKSES